MNTTLLSSRAVVEGATMVTTIAFAVDEELAAVTAECCSNRIASAEIICDGGERRIKYVIRNVLRDERWRP